MKFDELVQVMGYILNKCGEIFEYNKSWGNDFCIKELLESYDRAKFYTAGKPIDLNEFTIEQLKTLRFSWWDEEKTLLLIPIWIKQLLPQDLEVYSFDGDACLLKDADNDNRFGSLAFGIRR